MESDRADAAPAGASPPRRCEWAATELSTAYHDAEWGVPQHDDRRLFEMLTLEGAQAGLSWETILRKRARYREVFEGFDPARVAAYGVQEIDALMRDAGIVRNRAKIESTIANARGVLALQEEHGTLARYLWSFIDGAPQRTAARELRQLPAKTPTAEAMSRALKRRGFSFVGPTICYAFMQAVGMVNDHLVGCFRRDQVGGAPSGSGTER